MNQDKEHRAKHIQQAIRDILLKDWDPIGVSGAAEAQDEYDGYIAAIYRLLVSKVSEDTIIEHLSDIEANAMRLGALAKTDHLRPVAKKLLALDI